MSFIKLILVSSVITLVQGHLGLTYRHRHHHGHTNRTSITGGTAAPHVVWNKTTTSTTSTTSQITITEFFNEDATPSAGLSTPGIELPAAQATVNLDFLADSVCGSTVTVTTWNTATVTVTPAAVSDESQNASAPNTTSQAVTVPSNSEVAAPDSILSATSSTPPQSVISALSTNDPSPTQVSAQSTPTSATATQSSLPQGSSTGEAPSSPVGSSSGGFTIPSGKPKRGIIMSAGLTPLMANNPKMGCGMTWNQGLPSNLPSNWVYLREMEPLVADANFAETLQKGLSQTPNARILSGPLEANFNHTLISDLVATWKTNIEPFHETYELMGPLNGANVTYTQEFEAACTGCHLSGTPIGFTMYSSGDDAGIASLKRQVTEYSTAWPDRKLWVANVGHITGSAGTPDYLMRGIVPWLEANDHVEYYMWNSGGGDHDVFVDGDQLTALGQLYASL
ncbi:hypothetical protein MMC09_006962 [Bachmanniomyces sp. S44760]|nr:hypothetical protein [Bachmanniomyces sp. S44760]